MTNSVLDQFREAGEDLQRLGLITSHGGNISMRHQGKILITTHFAMLGRLAPGDVVEIPLREDPGRIVPDASKDAAFHQLIYKFTPAMAIIHAHPAHAVALSLNSGSIIPPDLEGSVYLREIPVIATDEQSSRVPQILQTHVALMVRGHGSYAVGRTLSEALAYSSSLELSCRIAYLSASLGSAAAPDANGPGK